jgi:hypothetical protein
MLKQRGWSNKLIHSLLGEPDLTKMNPFYRSAPGMKLYLLKRVEEAEKNKAFIDFQPLREKYRQRALKVAEKKRDELLAYVEALKIKIPRFPKDQLYKFACKHYNRLWEEREAFDKHAEPADDEAFLNRIAVNFLRHACSSYEDRLEELHGKVGNFLAYFALKEKILTKIAECYPYLAEECKRQNGDEDDDNGEENQKQEVPVTNTEGEHNVQNQIQNS